MPLQKPIMIFTLNTIHFFQIKKNVFKSEQKYFTRRKNTFDRDPSLVQNKQI